LSSRAALAPDTKQRDQLVTGEGGRSSAARVLAGLPVAAAGDPACPDQGQPPHRYQITVYALSVEKLPVPAEASGAMVTYTAHGYILAKATLTARYGR
jgi:phosphatidylethanolamine-binding protein (PEBP) family uncharacterized protein